MFYTVGWQATSTVSRNVDLLRCGMECVGDYARSWSANYDGSAVAADASLTAPSVVGGGCEKPDTSTGETAAGVSWMTDQGLYLTPNGVNKDLLKMMDVGSVVSVVSRRLIG